MNLFLLCFQTLFSISKSSFSLVCTIEKKNFHVRVVCCCRERNLVFRKVILLFYVIGAFFFLLTVTAMHVTPKHDF